MIEYLQRQEGEKDSGDVSVKKVINGIEEVKSRAMSTYSSEERSLVTAEDLCGVFSEEKEVCSSCGEIITGEIYTDRFYEVLCRRCLLRLHKI